jgi:hypothetical protein
LVGSYFPQEFDPDLGDYKSSKKSIKPYLITDLMIQYKIGFEYKILFGLKNLGNHTNSSYGPYIGRVSYFEIQKTFNN